MLTIRTLLADCAIAVWVTLCTVALLYWIPSRSYFPRQFASSAALAGSLARTLLSVVLGVALLAQFGLFNWLTLVLGYTSCLFANGYYRTGRQAWNALRHFCESCCFGLFDALDSGVNWHRLGQRVKREIGSCFEPLSMHRLSANLTWTLVVVVLLSFSILVRYEHPLLELRFAQADDYQTLLATRQILAGDWPGFPVSVYSCLLAALSLMSAVDPMQVQRFLGPLVGLLLVGLVGQLVWRLTERRGAATAAVLSLGVYCFTVLLPVDPSPELLPALLQTLALQLNQGLVRQWAPANPEIGALCLLLSWLSLLPFNSRLCRRSKWVNLFCGVCLVVLAAPEMLPLQILGSLGLLIRPRLGLGTMGCGWLSLALLTAAYPDAYGHSLLITLPVGLSLLVGGLFAFLQDCLQVLPRSKALESLSLILVFSLIINFALPVNQASAYLEHDITARTAITLNNQYLSKRWMLVAPIEQFAETYGDSWYSDLATFVETYEQPVQQPGFNFPVSVPDLFVFVEKRPFQTFQREPLVVSGEVAFDPVYRNYRLVAGRSSLQFEALELCEQYRLHHSDSRIYYEDETLRVYHFKVPVLETQAAYGED
ncbi:MAG: hypothetical protein WBB01_17835 [Phormidesmis sp.]